MTNPLDPTGNITASVSAIQTACNAILKAITPAVVPVPPPVTAPTPPPVTTVPSTVTPIISDDFTGYSNTAALQASISTTAGGKGGGMIKYQDGWNANLITLDTSVLYNGHPTMKLEMPAGVQTCPKLISYLPTSYDKIYFRTKIRFSPGFTTKGTNSGANAYKLLGWGHTTYDGGGRLEIANTSQYQLYWSIQATGSGALIGGGKYLLDGNINTEWADSAWYDYIICIDRSSGTQGFASAWWQLDGQPLAYKGITPAETMNNGSAMPSINSVQWSMEFNQTRAATQEQAIWIGAWEVFDGTKYPNPF